MNKSFSSSLLLVTLTNTMTRSNLGNEKVYFVLHFHGTSHRGKSGHQLKTGIQRQEPCCSRKHGVISWSNSLIVKEVNKKHGRTLAVDYPYTDQVHIGVVPPTVGQVLQHHLIKTVSYKHFHRPICLDNSSIKSFVSDDSRLC